MVSEILPAVRSMAVAFASPYTVIDYGALPAVNGLSISPATGTTTEQHLNKGGMGEIVFVLNGKHTDLQALVTALSNIHRGLALSDYPNGETWEVTNIVTVSAPVYLDKETSGQWLYGSSIRVEYYSKGA